ncbi:YGL185C [Saccharomyces arboricola H-6]|uniref:YGL185C n=1 Tax=Saccharomyces arboricola (strain H-6 / AS 2.3317 / CBS 10644) TaxID=1160507 RepID=J8LNW7_SACAR|nr:YGL185C [Saccharomyces arboricola H-6]
MLETSVAARKPTILFIADPCETSTTLNSDVFKEKYNILRYHLGTKEAFMSFLDKHEHYRICAIYAGFPAFVKIGGLTRDIIEYKSFPRNDLKCIVLCSRGYNGWDLDALREHNIRLYNYQDDHDEKLIQDLKLHQVGNDVADCALWHILEGFRKFSYGQKLARETANTLAARSKAAGKSGFAFGHELGNMSAKSPRGEKCLILGLGSIGKQLAYKLQHGLGMEIHYCKRNEDPTIPQNKDWKFHRLDETLYAKLHQFSAIVITLPGTPQTKHLINKEFLKHCSPELILINMGRGIILDPQAVSDTLTKGQIRHLGIDVFYNEPQIDETIASLYKLTSITPHLGSSTKDVFEQSCELALARISRVISGEVANDECFSLIV